jgi:hypothetical protein
MSIEADRQIVAALTLSVRMLDSLRRTARLLSTHLSTQIEGNRLTAAQVQAVVEGEGNFPGRERDEAEVRNYFAALKYVQELARKSRRLTEKEIRAIHGLVGCAGSTRSRSITPPTSRAITRASPSAATTIIISAALKRMSRRSSNTSASGWRMRSERFAPEPRRRAERRLSTRPPFCVRFRPSNAARWASLFARGS